MSESDLLSIIKSIKFSEILNVGAMPCAKKSFIAGISMGLPIAFLRYWICKKWRSAGNWGFMTWAFGGSISYQYCIYQRRVVLQEFEKMAKSNS